MVVIQLESSLLSTIIDSTSRQLARKHHLGAAAQVSAQRDPASRTQTQMATSSSHNLVVGILAVANPLKAVATCPNPEGLRNVFNGYVKTMVFVKLGKGFFRHTRMRSADMVIPGFGQRERGSAPDHHLAHIARPSRMSSLGPLWRNWVAAARKARPELHPSQSHSGQA